ncbi:hypothetical protein CPC08DRAFT_771039 [Agrocybe pediades]|nr:hypothetical protein CPC08DRAFT_771039 [Agrocybe pediades]
MDSSEPYTLDCLASFAGYVLSPTVIDAMLFLLPRFALSSQRVVESLQRSWELWSPNSSRHVFYPGAQEFGTRFGQSIHASMHRYDGHEGRFDPTVTPQHFNKGRPWLGFIQTSADISHPEFNTITKVWVKSKPGHASKFDSSFVLQLAKHIHVLNKSVGTKAPLAAICLDLWAEWPSIPTKEDVAHLNLLTKWEEAVDYYTELQREIKYMAAWCCMVDAFIAYLKEHPEVDKEDGKWLLPNRVPCFIIHELTAKESRDWFTRSKHVNDFHSGTGVVRLQVAANPLDQIAKKNRNALLELNWELGQASALDHGYLPMDRERSSIVTQGWRNSAYCNPRKVVVVKDPVPEAPVLTVPGIRLPPLVTCAIDLGG